MNTTPGINLWLACGKAALILKCCLTGRLWRSGLVRWCWDQGSTGSNPTAVSMSLCPWDTSPQIAPVGIAHSIEYVSRFG